MSAAAGTLSLGKTTPWVKCDCCDDYICNVHLGKHAWECECPAIDIWADYQLYPYGQCDGFAVEKMLKEQPFDPES